MVKNRFLTAQSVDKSSAFDTFRQVSIDSDEVDKNQFSEILQAGFDKVKESKKPIYRSIDFNSPSYLRQSRVKVEKDWSSLRSRVRMLEQEEKRALKAIEETKAKADQILQNRKDHESLKSQIYESRAQEYEKNR